MHPPPPRAYPGLLLHCASLTAHNKMAPVKKGSEETLFMKRQEEPAILISRLLLRMRRTYVDSIRLDFH